MKLFTRRFFPLLMVTFFVAAVVTGQGVPGDSEPKLLTNTRFTLPQSVIDAEIDGKVQVAIFLDDKGKPKKAVMSAGPMWPCGTQPIKAIDDLDKALTEMAMSLTFSPAIKSGKAESRALSLTLELKNPKLEFKPEIDPATGKPKEPVITGSVLNGKALSLGRPNYPSEAKARRDGGSVDVLILISEDGSILRAGALNGAATLQFAARDAACRSKFSPTLLAGNPVKVSGIVTYNFVP